MSIDYVVTGRGYEDDSDNDAIAYLVVREISKINKNGEDKLTGKEPIIFTTEKVIKMIEIDNKIFCTFNIKSKASAIVNVVNDNNTKYLRTKKDGIETNNLDELPEI